MLVEILTAICLVLVLEGIMPFLSPRSYKDALRALLQVSDDKIRIVGLSSMLVGVVLLVLIR